MINNLRLGLPNLSFFGVVRPRLAADSDAVEIDEVLSGTIENQKGVTHNHSTTLWPPQTLNKDTDYGFNALINESLCTWDIAKGPGSAGFRGEPGLKPGSPSIKWWRKQS